MIYENLHDLKIHLESSLKTSLPAGPETAMQAKAFATDANNLSFIPRSMWQRKKGTLSCSQISTCVACTIHPKPTVNKQTNK